MYFNNIPNIQYDNKPIQYPFSESDFSIVKNFFRRYQVNPDVFSYAVFFNKYAIKDSERIDQIAERTYGDPFLDWVIVLTNNLVNPLFDWPLNEYELRKHAEKKYNDPYREIHHYETYEIKNAKGDVILPGGLIVDEKFYKAPELKTDTTSSFLPTQNIGIQASARTDTKFFVGEIKIVNGGEGYESTPTLIIDGNAIGSVELYPKGKIKRINILNPGSGYEYPPIIEFTGSLESLSATAFINEVGNITEILLDGIKFDTTNSDQIYEFGNGTTIAPNGSGIGSTGGFDIGSTHLRFGDSPGTRYAILNPVDTTNVDTVRVYAIRGNGSNGGETPDIAGEEDLRLQYQITSGAPDPNNWIDLGIVIDAVPNGTGTGVLDNYDFTLPPELKSENVYFRLYQINNSGADYDHYGILSVNFLNINGEYEVEASINILPNPLQVNPVTQNAEASVTFGRKIAYATVQYKGSNYFGTNTYSAYTINGNPSSVATFDVVLDYEMTIQLLNPGNAYTEALISLTGGGGSNALASISVKDNKISNVSLRSKGTGYTSSPTVVISPPDSEVLIQEDENFYFNGDSWIFKNGVWKRKVSSGFKYFDNGEVKELPGESISFPVYAFDYEVKENEKKREIYLLKPIYLEAFLSDFKKTNLYKKSSDYIDNKLKKTGV